MSPEVKKTIEDKLFLLQETSRILDELRPVAEKDFINDYHINHIAMFDLSRGIEIVVDIGQHLLHRHLQITGAKTYEDIIVELGNTRIVPATFAEENKKMAGFRNRLIHDYDRINLHEVYQHLQKAPDIFRTFAKYFVEFMEREEGKGK